MEIGGFCVDFGVFLGFFVAWTGGPLNGKGTELRPVCWHVMSLASIYLFLQPSPQ